MKEKRTPRQTVFVNTDTNKAYSKYCIQKGYAKTKRVTVLLEADMKGKFDKII